jgi:hypothetical protein
MGGRESPDTMVKTGDDETTGIPCEHQQHVQFYR